MSAPGADRSATAAEPFSVALRAATWDDHGQAESAGFMAALLAGELPRADYARLLGQYWFIYTELEAAGDAMRDDPVAGAFVTDALHRQSTLEADLAHLLGPAWPAQIDCLPATLEYADRIRNRCSTDAGAFVAHHYTRYLGDLSGGSHIGRVVRRVYELEPDAGAAFYDFPGIDDPKTFKDAYRSRLDRVPWSVEEQAAVIDEIRVGYALNRGVFADLAVTAA